MLESLARIAVYVPGLFLLGAIGYRYRYGRSDALDRLAVAAGGALVIALLARAFAHTYAAFGEEALSWESFRTVALESRWGRRWRWQLASAVVALASLSVARAAPRIGWALATAAGLGLAASLPLTGHAMALGGLALALQSAHVAGAGLWIGTLFNLAVLGGSFRRFAPLAMVGAFLVVASGMGTAWLSFPTAGDLWESTYGRLFLAKLALVAGVLGCGFLNWRHYRSKGAESGGHVRLEIAFATLVLALTGWLSETGAP